MQPEETRHYDQQTIELIDKLSTIQHDSILGQSILHAVHNIKSAEDLRILICNLKQASVDNPKDLLLVVGEELFNAIKNSRCDLNR